MQALEAIGALPIPNGSAGQSRTRVTKDSPALPRQDGSEDAETTVRRHSESPEAQSLSLSEDGNAKLVESSTQSVSETEEESLLGPQSAEEQLAEAVQSIREQRPSLGSASFKITYNEDVSRYVIQIVDRETGDEIQQIPSEKLLEVSKRLGDVRGLLFDEKS